MGIRNICLQHGLTTLSFSQLTGLSLIHGLATPCSLHRSGSKPNSLYSDKPLRIHSKRQRPACCHVDLSPPSHPSVFEPLLTLLNPPPRPVTLARKPLDQDFAVLLMRSGYAAVDELDFVPMQVFQAVFFDIRSREWELFITKNFGMRQGMIADPRYFDFISYAQMLTIQHFMRAPRVVFEEAYGDADGQFHTRVVRRDLDALPTPESLLRSWRQLVGNAVYMRMLNTVSRPQPVLNADVGALKSGIRQIYDYFLLAGFCLEINFESSEDALCRVELIAPCILWGSQALRRVGSIPNDYDCLCVHAFCARSGVAAECSTTFSENSIIRRWVLNNAAGVVRHT